MRSKSDVVGTLPSVPQFLEPIKNLAGDVLVLPRRDVAVDDAVGGAVGERQLGDAEADA
jgi:hypothetical protein